MKLNVSDQMQFKGLSNSDCKYQTNLEKGTSADQHAQHACSTRVSDFKTITDLLRQIRKHLVLLQNTDNGSEEH